METKLAEIESFYYDLRSSADAIKKFLKRNPFLTKKNETNIGVFYSKIFSITETFNAVIASIDLNFYDKTSETKNQFNKAYDAYRDGGTLLPGKFFRMYNVMVNTIIPVRHSPNNLIHFIDLLRTYKFKV